MAYEEQKAILIDGVTIASSAQETSDPHDFEDALVLNPHLWLEITGFSGVIGDDDTITIRVLGILDEGASPDTYLVWGGAYAYKPKGTGKERIAIQPTRLPRRFVVRVTNGTSQATSSGAVTLTLTWQEG
ncbi:MAG: hypothetical protein WC145_10200 [Aliarcobacter sp.]|jgi:hypothetical protein